MSTENQAALLQEHNSCDAQISRIDSLIWQTASIVFPITLAGFAYFGLSATHTAEQFVVLCVVASGSISLLITWYLLSRQWYAYQAIAFYRVREIETELDLWHYRYSFFMRRSKPQRQAAVKAMEGEEKNRFQKLESQVGGFPRVGLRVAIGIITAIFLLGWFGLLIREYLITFTP